MAGPDQILDAGVQPPVGVANPAQIEFYIGNPPRQMLIFSGVGVTDLYAEEEDPVIWREVAVKLGASTTPNFQYTSTVGLASITCDDSDFNFFANKSSVIADAMTGELELHATLAASGDPGTLNRFSYHVQVLSDPVVGSIMGTIRWADFYGQPSADVLDDGLPPMFEVDAGITVDDPSSPISLPKFERRVTGYSTAIPKNYNGTWVVPYKIDNVPLGQLFVVQPKPPGANLVNTPGNYEGEHPYFNPSQRAVELTPTAPAAVGIDFDMLLPERPK
jgi:hypothetical protein